MTHSPRLIEQWLPIAALSLESLRERTPMTPFPAPNRLHVWWARRPLVASRAAVLASLLPANADHDLFLHLLGIHGDPVAVRKRIDNAKRTGEKLLFVPTERLPTPKALGVFGYDRAFSYVPTEEEKREILKQSECIAHGIPLVLDPTAGGGSIPFEASRLGFNTTANDLNPVASLILEATVKIPYLHGLEVVSSYDRIVNAFMEKAQTTYESYNIFPNEPDPDSIVDGYLWARTITCPDCSGLVPLSPNWRLAPGGTGVRLLPQTSPQRVCRFEIVRKASHQSEGTVKRGAARCPFDDCRANIDGDEIKRQAQAGHMGEQLFAVVFKERTLVGNREKWIRDYRAPRPDDDVADLVQQHLTERMPHWEAFDCIPNEAFPEIVNDERPRIYGMPLWRDMFSPRQLLCHVTSVEIFRALVDEEREAGRLDEPTQAAFVYLSFALDKLLNYNSRMSVWMPTREVVANTFNRHDFAFCWSHAEMAPLIVGMGYDWAFEQTKKAVLELMSLVRPEMDAKAAYRALGERGEAGANGELFSEQGRAARAQTTEGEEGWTPPKVEVTCQSASSLYHVDAGTVDAVVMDPPYYDNVMYAELSDFFYVWLKRTAGYVLPDLFWRELTDKEQEAVANPAKFKGAKGAKKLAYEDYRQRMQDIFAECRRVLKADGILTLMFTHKATGAWDALAQGLLNAGFEITASWPINTEAEGSMHIKDKAAAKSTIFLVCRPKQEQADGEKIAWEDLEPKVRKRVRESVEEFKGYGIGGVDLYLSCFGRALGEFAKHWPDIYRENPRAHVEKGEDPYAVTPEDALNAARAEVKNWRLDSLFNMERRADLDKVLEWFVLAWDAFRAPTFPYDEGMQLARVVGVELEKQIVGYIAEKKGSNLMLWDSVTRREKKKLRSNEGKDTMLDALHYLAALARQQDLSVAREAMEKMRLDKDQRFLDALCAVLEVLPVPPSMQEQEILSQAQVKEEKQALQAALGTEEAEEEEDEALEGGAEADDEDEEDESGKSLVGAAAFAVDFEKLEMLRRLALGEITVKPRQLGLFGKP